LTKQTVCPDAEATASPSMKNRTRGPLPDAVIAKFLRFSIRRAVAWWNVEAGNTNLRFAAAVACAAPLLPTVWSVLPYIIVDDERGACCPCGPVFVGSTVVSVFRQRRGHLAS
jgi:hypothetical protein